MAVVDLCARRVRCYRVAIRVHPLEGNGRTSIGPHGFRPLESVVREVGIAERSSECVHPERFPGRARFRAPLPGYCHGDDRDSRIEPSHGSRSSGL